MHFNRGAHTIFAHRANAASAAYSRVVAQRVYSTTERPFGYAYGGSGGAFRTIGSFENTTGVWDGVVPYVMGSNMAIPNMFTWRMRTIRVLGPKLDGVVDAADPGGAVLTAADAARARINIDASSERQRGGVDTAFRIPEGIEGQRVAAFRLGNTPPKVTFLGGHLLVQSGAAKGKRLPLARIVDSIVVLGVADASVASQLKQAMKSSSTTLTSWPWRRITATR